MFTVICIFTGVFGIICIFICKVTPEEAGVAPDNEPLEKNML